MNVLFLLSPVLQNLQRIEEPAVRFTDLIFFLLSANNLALNFGRTPSFWFELDYKLHLNVGEK